MKKWIKILFIISIFICNDMLYFISDVYQEKINNLKETIKEKENKIELIKDEKEKDKEKYKKTLQSIVKNIKLNDSFLNIGGYNSNEIYNNDNYKEIVKEKVSFESLLKNVDNFFITRKKYLSNLPNVWPVRKNNSIRITSPFGKRLNPFTGKFHKHKGIDIAGRWQTPIIATADGIVIEHWIYHDNYGRMILIKHENGYKTRYAHLSKSFVHSGYKVEKGDVIGFMGTSGRTSKGIHLHYEIIRNNKPVNPINYLRSEFDKKK